MDRSPLPTSLRSSTPVSSTAARMRCESASRKTHPYLAKQTRLTFARCGITDPVSLEDYAAHGGWRGLTRAIEIGPAAIIAEVTQSGLRGRGGAGFPTGIKWKTVADCAGDRKYVVCNADEGDSGTFADRMVLEDDPFMLDRRHGDLRRRDRRDQGLCLLPLRISAWRRRHSMKRCSAPAVPAGSAPTSRARTIRFDIELRMGAGAYVCGEETALLESLEGKRGIVRAKPPLPAHKGLFQQPTVVNNVLSFAATPFILSEGGAAYAQFGMGRSRGTMPLQIAGNVRYGGLYETAFGLTLGEIVEEIGGGTVSGRPVRAVQCGGPLGAYFPKALFDTPFDYEAFAARDGLIGHGGIVVFDDTVDMADMARFAMEFCAIESCGKCTPCRIGSTRGQETVERVMKGENVADNLTLLEDLCQTMKFGSLCALGGFAPYPVMSALRHFPEDFRPQTAAAAE